MKMRRMMAIVAVLGVLTWLAAPAVWIWSDSSLRPHRHDFVSKDASLDFDLETDIAISQGQSLLIYHQSNFWDVYRGILLRGRQGGRIACPEIKVSRRSTNSRLMDTANRGDVEVSAWIKKTFRPFWLKSPDPPADHSDTSR